ncbi:PBP1A family penicillin-binding protein [uncultured Paludibaculum sp.]|uniref:transglycosylase domain-containing protein n=1 Tax=uncultured Paludibaculum sp. TaxID=1765020 RepID=UPI002AABC865|nr:PBP1A family penicillin-binding protein [uncultured Paludibaculum sp.]
MRKQAPRKAPLVGFFQRPVGKTFLALTALSVIVFIGVFSYYWVKYSRLIDQKLKEGPFTETAQLFATPEPIAVGDNMTADEVVAALKRRGYTESRSNRLGWYHVRTDGVEIFPGVDAYVNSEPGVVFLSGGVVTRIISNKDNTERQRYFLDPELITNLFDRKREKRRLVRYSDIPQILVQAVISIEDKRFFEHSGFDPLRIIRTAWVDVTQNRRYGASTISMQTARNLWLTQDKTPQRKAAEVLITLQIEQKLTKEQIFEFYSNQVDLGQHRSFAVHGFGEAAQVYFGKDIRELRVEEAALLAGMIQRPNYFNPYRHPERAGQRRNIVLKLMRENGFITDLQYIEAAKAPIKVMEGGAESTDAPYFVDLVNDDLQENFSDIDFQTSSYRIYTTLDMKLQRDAVEAVNLGMAEVDNLLAKRKKKYPQAQVAMLALDPHTAEIKALVGGRNYGASQLNRVLSKRQPGSAFKPFVYASVLSTTLDGQNAGVTPVTQVVDEPTTFFYDGQEYEPGNYHGGFNGLVTMRQALSKSLNIPTVKFAEMAGYGNVANLARRAGMEGVRATPALALGSYEVTPLDIAGAYTIFSNNGVYTKQNLIKEVRSSSGGLIHEYRPVRRGVLDPRVAYMVVNMMEEVLRTGTGAGARARGFGLPAAGKTGTSHDAWFAGFTSKLLCIVWVGFDDNQELPLEGASAALPIWTEFMKRAHRYREYRGVQQFEAPDGIATVDIDPLSGQLATVTCPNPRPEVFIAGTQPVDLCHLHSGGGRTQVASWDTPEPATAAQAPSGGGQRVSPRPSRAKAEDPVADAKPQETPRKTEKKGIGGWFRAIFK